MGCLLHVRTTAVSGSEANSDTCLLRMCTWKPGVCCSVFFGTTILPSNTSCANDEVGEDAAGF